MMAMDVTMKIQSWGNRIDFADGAVLGRIGAQVFGMVRERVQERGLDADGRPFPPYSDTWPPKGMILPARGSGRWGRIRGGIQCGKRNRWKKFKSMRHFRQEQGLPVDRKRFSLTGQMWESGKVHVRLYFGVPVTVLGFVGNVSDAHTQDWGLQVRAQKRQERKGHGYHHWRTGKKKTVSSRRSVRVARPAMKAAMQFKEINAGRSLLEISQRELEFARDVHLEHISQEFRDKAREIHLGGRVSMTFEGARMARAA